jgi:hypothetical protein
MTLHPCHIRNSSIPRTDGDRHPPPAQAIVHTRGYFQVYLRRRCLSTGIHPHTQIGTDILDISSLSLVPFPIQMEIYGKIILARRLSIFAETRVVAWILYLEDGIRVNSLLKFEQ